MSIPNPLEELTLDQLRSRTSLKWREYPEDVLPLWVAEMDVLLAEPISHALIDSVRRGDTGYPSGTIYAEALQTFAHDRWNWDGIDLGRTAIVPDVMMGIVEMLRLVTDPGDAVVVNCPVYPPFYSFVEHMDRRIVEAPLGPEHRIDLDALSEAFTDASSGGRSAAFLLCNPHNPTGTVHTAKELTAVAALAAEHNVRVVADEIHAPVVMPGEQFVPFLSVPGAGNGFSLMSASRPGISPGSSRRLPLPARMPLGTWRGCLKRSATGPATWASLPIRRPSGRVAIGSMHSSPVWTTTVGSSPTCFRNISPASGTHPNKRPSSHGSTAVSLVSTPAIRPSPSVDW